MQRRLLLLGSFISAAALPLDAVLAGNRCNPTGCVARVDIQKFIARADIQHQSEWCWAACISMLFNYYGHPVRQDRIVSEAYGMPANIPAISGMVISAELNRDWVDDNNKSFQSSLTAAFDAQEGLAAINNAMIVQALSDGHPLIMGAGGHATVVTGIAYAPTPFGPNVVGVEVFDPWPGKGLRTLSLAEMVPAPRGALMFLALANVVAA